MCESVSGCCPKISATARKVFCPSRRAAVPQPSPLSPPLVRLYVVVDVMMAIRHDVPLRGRSQRQCVTNSSRFAVRPSLIPLNTQLNRTRPGAIDDFVTAMPRSLSTLATIVADFGDNLSRKQRLSQKTATVAEFGDCRRCLAVFGDSRTFLRVCDSVDRA